MASTSDNSSSFISNIAKHFSLTPPQATVKKHNSDDSETDKNSENRPTNKKARKSRHNPYNNKYHPTTRSMTKQGNIPEEIDTDMEVNNTSDTASMDNDELTSKIDENDDLHVNTITISLQSETLHESYSELLQ